MEWKFRKPLRKRTTFQRMLALLLAVLVGQIIIYFVTFFVSGALDETERNSFYILSERTANRALDLENDMVGRWSNLDECENQIFLSFSSVMENYDVSIGQVLANPQLCEKVVSSSAADLVTALRQCGVTGAFLILNGEDHEDGYPGFYIRDYDPTSFSGDNSDLLMERGLPEISRTLRISMDSYWSARFRFDSKNESASDFFFKPLNAALNAPPASRNNVSFHYWSGQYLLSSADRPVIAYSYPLIWKDGTVLGVLGVDVTVDYLAEQLPYDELGENRSGAYLLGVTHDGGETYDAVCSSGPNFRAYFGKADSLSTARGKHEDAVLIQGAGNYSEEDIYGTPRMLRLYNSGSPFESGQWALIGIMSGENLLSFSRELKYLMLLSAVLSLALGLALIVAAARSFTRPLGKLMTALKQSDPDQPIRLPRTALGEVDSLSTAIENLSNAAAESAARTSKIIAMSHIPIGVFEYRSDTSRVFCSKSLFELLDWPERPSGDAYLPSTEFFRRIEAVTGQKQDAPDSELIFHLPRTGERERWVQFFFQTEGDGTLGAFLDVTADMETKRRMEYERDYDILTGLYNRRAFDLHTERLFLSGGALKTAGLLMLDLDNLKYVNDTYGHDYGDRYIQSFAQCLAYFSRFRTVLGRRSGDEFNVFLYGFETQDAIRATIKDFQRLLEQSSVPLPGGECIRVRASGGLAWYQQDSAVFTELLRMADFAMYTVKHTVKGAVQEFSHEEYERRSILIQGQDALNQFLDRRMVRYAVQSIVSARDGSIYGYEFLMRPQLSQLADLSNLMMLAKSQSKLRQIEELTWFESMKTYAQLLRDGSISPDAYAFINSIGNQRLSEEDLLRLEELYGELLSHVVAEITEGEESDALLNLHKKEKIAQWQAQLALDDFGTGYNSEKVLIQISPNIVKVDMSIIRGINADSDRRAMFQNVVRYAKSRGIMVLAEGVETPQELEALIAYGADFLQGFYLNRPSFDPQPLPAARVDEIRRLYSKYHGGA